MQPDTEESLSTGMANLDAKFERDGLLKGSVVSVRGSPSSLSDVVAYNFISGRDTVYVGFGEISATTKKTIKRAGELDPASLSIIELSTTASAKTFTQRIEEQDTTSEMTFLVDPLNFLESTASESELADALSSLKTIAEQTDSLCVLHLLVPEEVPTNRWVTVSNSDAVFSALHDTSRDTVRESLAIDKLHPLQSLYEDETRAFSLSPAIDIDISTKQSLSP